jgi:hypothetical protein
MPERNASSAALSASGSEEARRHGGGARADARGGGTGWRRGALGVAASGHAVAARGARGGGAGRTSWWPVAGASWWEAGKERKRDARVRDLGFWVKFDGAHVAHVFNLRTWVPTFLLG